MTGTSRLWISARMSASLPRVARISREFVRSSVMIRTRPRGVAAVTAERLVVLRLERARRAALALEEADELETSAS